MTSAKKAARARLNQAYKQSVRVSGIITDLRKNGFHGGAMQELRDVTEELVQCVHEYSAYTNMEGN